MMKKELFVLEYLEPFNCVQTLVIHVCKQISSHTFKNKITNKLLTYKSYIQPLDLFQINELRLVLKCYLLSMPFESYICMKNIWH